MAYGNGGSYGTATISAPGMGVAQNRETLTSRLDLLTDALHGSVSDLEHRLSPVLVPAPPEANTASTPKPPCAPMGDLVDRVQYALARIQSIAGRIDL